jgi:hypothetical protein
VTEKGKIPTPVWNQTPIDSPKSVTLMPELSRFAQIEAVLKALSLPIVYVYFVVSIQNTIYFKAARGK